MSDERRKKHAYVLLPACVTQYRISSAAKVLIAYNHYRKDSLNLHLLHRFQEKGIFDKNYK